MVCKCRVSGGCLSVRQAAAVVGGSAGWGIEEQQTHHAVKQGSWTYCERRVLIVVRWWCDVLVDGLFCAPGQHPGIAVQ